jgi:hypothetical protein
MTASLPIWLLAAGTVLGGLLAGSNVDRAFIAMPAWRSLGAKPWAEFSRRADLSNGLVVYPLEAVGSALLSLAAAVLLSFSDNAGTLPILLLWLAVVANLSGLALTAKAAPIMLGLRGPTDAASEATALAGFRYWGDLRGIFQVLAFVIQVLALATIAGGAP